MANIGGQRPARGSQFSHTTMCVLGNELRTSSLVAGASIHTKQHFLLKCIAKSNVSVNNDSFRHEECV